MDKGNCFSMCLLFDPYFKSRKRITKLNLFEQKLQNRYKERRKSKAFLYLFCFFVRNRYKFVILFFYFDEKRIIPDLSRVTLPNARRRNTACPCPCLSARRTALLRGSGSLFFAPPASCTNVSTLYT